MAKSVKNKMTMRFAMALFSRQLQRPGGKGLAFLIWRGRGELSAMKNFGGILVECLGPTPKHSTKAFEFRSISERMLSDSRKRKSPDFSGLSVHLRTLPDYRLVRDQETNN